MICSLEKEVAMLQVTDAPSGQAQTWHVPRALPQQCCCLASDFLNQAESLWLTGI